MAVTTGSTGIRGADKFCEKAQKLGLTVSTKTTTSEPVVFEGGGEMLPGCTTVIVTVKIPVPESLSTSALALIERASILSACWKRDHNGRARGRWILGNYSTLGATDDMHTLRRTMIYLNVMARSLKRLQRYDEEG